MTTQSKKAFATYSDLHHHLSSKLIHQPHLADVPIGEDIFLFLDKEPVSASQTVEDVSSVCGLMVDLLGNIETPCPPMDAKGLSVVFRCLQVKLKSIDESKLLD